MAEFTYKYSNPSLLIPQTIRSSFSFTLREKDGRERGGRERGGREREGREIERGRER